MPERDILGEPIEVEEELSKNLFAVDARVIAVVQTILLVVLLLVEAL